MDAVYVVRHGRATTALAYSLRSLEACVDVDRVWFVGRPWGGWHVDWVSTSGRETNDKWVNIDVCWRTIADHEDISDTFVYMNDDFFFLRPIDHIPYHHRGPLTDEAIPLSNYGRGRVEMLDFLNEHRLSTWDFELHLPMTLDKSGIRRMYDIWGDLPLYGYQRSLYGNVMEVDAQEIDDVKIRMEKGWLPTSDHWVVSSDPISWFQHPTFTAIRDHYPRPSRWEGMET